MNNEEIKMVIIIRKDLGMRKGKMIAMGCHASLKVILDQFEKVIIWVATKEYTDSIIRNTKVPEEKLEQQSKYYLDIKITDPLYKWLTGLFTKIVVYVNSEEELLNVYNQAKEKDIICSLIQDAGKTEFKGIPTYTCCAIGPDYSEKINEITGKLPLL